MAGYLNFDPNRKLEFDTSRTLDFEPGRPLQFLPNRELEFQPNRDLGFGHRGIVFRGYICPICGALVSPDATSCNECGAVFEGPPTPPPPPPPAAPPAGRRRSGGRPPTQASPRPATPSRPGVSYCTYCGVQLHAGDAFCWNCGNKMAGGTEAVKLPAKKTEPVTREWRRAEER